MPMFVDTAPPGQCIFCRLVAGEIPAVRVYEDAPTIAFMDIGQVNPGHVLVATQRHAATLLDTTPEVAAAVMQKAQQVAHAEQAVLNLDHLHGVPRHAQDGIGRCAAGPRGKAARSPYRRLRVRPPCGCATMLGGVVSRARRSARTLPSGGAPTRACRRCWQNWLRSC